MNDHALRRLAFDKIRQQLAEHTTFSGGRELALALAPSLQAEEVRHRLALTREARAWADRAGSPPLGGAHDVRPEVDGARRGRTLLASELLAIRDTVAAARRTKRALTGGGAIGHWPLLADLASGLDPCPALLDAIQSSLDDEGNVLDGASATLASVRRDLRVARDRLSRHLEGMLARSGTREFLQEPLVTQRNGRQVLPVKAEFRARVPGVVHDTSDSGATVFVEPLGTIELGNRLRELEVEEQKEVMRVLGGLSEHVAEEADDLVETVGSLAQVDLCFACGSYGYAIRATDPEVVEGKPRFEFRAARHPLLDPATVVAIDVYAGEPHTTLLITGPNTGGKTVTLKTVGLLVLMAQAGLQIPAQDGSMLTVFDGVFADIGDEQSIEQSLSTFSSHMTNIIDILRQATDRSLVLLDELGAGTDPAEGVALAGALLEHLRQRGCTTIASTHFSELKLYAHSTPGVANASVEFDMETLRPTYELAIGLPGRSNALAIAARLGLPEDVVRAARSGLAHSDVAMEELLAEIREARAGAAADRAAAAEARRQAEGWADRLQQAVSDVQVEEARIIGAAREQAEAELASVRQTLARLLAEAKHNEASAASLAETAARADRVAQALREAAPVPEQPASLLETQLRPGNRVRVKSADQEGEVLRVQGGRVEVQLPRLRLTVPFQDLAPAKTGEAEPAPAPRLHRAGGAPETVAMELDLRGIRVDEGLELLDTHLDKAVLAGLPWVRVIHGHGTGAMKAAVRDAVARHPNVTRWRPGERGEGGDGVTVAYLE